MAAWPAVLGEIEALEDLDLDAQLIAAMAGGGKSVPTSQTIDFYTPTFKGYSSSEIHACGKSSWPAVSITGGACKLQCDHCKAKVLEPMIAATSADALWRVANEQIERGAEGMLLTGGSNHRDEVEYGPFFATMARIKQAFPRFRLAIHTGLVDAATAQRIEAAGVDVAMLDIIGAEATIREVYHLKRPVADFAASLEHLTRTSLKVVPHIVIGLHYGQLLGEGRALDIVRQFEPDALVLVVVMPFYASSRRPFVVPDSGAVGRFFVEARAALPEIPLLLGCARPPGRARQQIDTYAVLAGLDGIAHPAEGVVELAARLGREVRVTDACCSVAVGGAVLAAGADSRLSVDVQHYVDQERAARLSARLGGIRVVAQAGA